MKIQKNRSSESSRTGGVQAKRAGRPFTVFLSALVAVAMLGAPSASFAGDVAQETGREGGLGAAAALSSLVYAPVKLVYATGGLIVGSFAWAFTAGDTEVATKVFTRSLRGTYVITPDHLTGERSVVFIGRDLDGDPSRPEAVASAEATTARADTSVQVIDESGYDEMGW